MKEIKELHHKYIGIIKIEDFRRLDVDTKAEFHFIMSRIDLIRHNKGKPPMSENSYVVLNLDDDISIQYLHDIIHNYFNKLGKTEEFYTVKVKYIAHHLVNAVLKTKDRQ